MHTTAVIYASTHHANTSRLVEAIAAEYSIECIDAAKQQSADLSQYDLIGFASGIAFGRFYDSVERFLENNLPRGKRVFFLYTCAKISDRFTKTVEEKARKADAVILGAYGCKGFNTYGP